MKKTIKVVKQYEECSGQLVNNSKGSFYVHEKMPLSICNTIKSRTGMRKGTFPFTYLGCPVYYCRKKSIYFEKLVRKIMKRVMQWQNRFLSFGARYILVAHVLQSIPVYLLSVMNTPKGVINQIHKKFARFFWGTTADNRKRHWWLGKVCVHLKQKVELILDLCMIHLKPYLENYGGITEHLLLCGVPIYETNIAKSYTQ